MDILRLLGDKNKAECITKDTLEENEHYNVIQITEFESANVLKVKYEDGSFKVVTRELIKQKNQTKFAQILTCYLDGVNSNAKMSFLLVDRDNQMLLSCLKSVYNCKTFAKKGRILRFMEVKAYKELTGTEKPVEQPKVIPQNTNCYSRNSNIPYSTTTIPQSGGYMHILRETIDKYQQNVLEKFVHGNLYVLLDCEFFENNKVREISILFCELDRCQLIPFTKVVCSDTDPVKVCSQFIIYFDRFVEELLTSRKLGKLYLVGHSIEADIIKIYRTLGLEPLNTYDYISTDHNNWYTIWDSISLNSVSQCSQVMYRLQDIVTRTLIQRRIITNITSELFDIQETRKHTSMFDVTALLIMLNLVLIRQIDVGEYREQHMRLIGDNIYT